MAGKAQALGGVGPGGSPGAAPPTALAGAAASSLGFETLGNLAHELRTPLMALLGYLDVLRDEWPEQVGGEPRRMLTRMQSSIDDLRFTVDNLVEFARSDSGSEAATCEEFEISELIDEVASVLDAACRSKGLVLRLEVGQPPETLVSDRRLLRLVLLNLGLNAIKFTAAGWVRVVVRGETAGGRYNFVVFEVNDSGPGISAQKIALAMRPFTQLSRTPARSFRGLGLGLAVVERILAMLGGKLEIESVPGQGSTFLFRLPCSRMPALR